MKISKVTVAVALALLFMGCSASTRELLQDGRPTQCDAGTGSWTSDDINCDFTCGNGWELDCETESSTLIKCKLDQDGRPDSEDVKFTCNYTSGKVSNKQLNVLSKLYF
jgi:hypothetical protein